MILITVVSGAAASKLLTPLYTKDLRASGAIPGADMVIRQCEVAGDSLHLVCGPRNRMSAGRTQLVVTDLRGEPLRWIDNTSSDHVRICGTASKRIRTLQVTGGRPVLIDYAQSGRASEAIEIDAYPAELIETSGERLIGLLSDGRFAAFSRIGPRMAPAKTIDGEIAIRPKRCDHCSSTDVIFPGEFLLAQLISTRVVAVDTGTATAYFVDLEGWKVEKLALRTPAIEASLNKYASVRQRLIEQGGPSRTPMNGMVVPAMSANSDGDFFLLLSPYNKSGAVVEQFDQFGRHRKTRVFSLQDVRSDGEWLRPDLIAATDDSLLLLCRFTGVLAAYSY